MCTVVILRNMFPDRPLIIAANRDEFYERTTAAPHLINAAPPVFGGQDLVAGGTWMGIRADGFFAALTNQPRAVGYSKPVQSRGQLVLSLLRNQTPAMAAQWLEGRSLTEFDYFNLVFGDAQGVYLAHSHQDFHWAEVPDGLSVLTNGLLNSPAFPKVTRIRNLWEHLQNDGVEPMDALGKILSDTEKPTTLPPAENQEGLPMELRRALHAICVHTPRYGTRSAAIVSVSDTGPIEYLYADGAPSKVSFKDVTSELNTAFNGQAE